MIWVLIETIELSIIDGSLGQKSERKKDSVENEEKKASWTEVDIFRLEESR